MRGKRFALVGCEVMLREFRHAAGLSEAAVDFYMLRQGLHETPDALREGIQGEVDGIEAGLAGGVAGAAAGRGYDAILLGYGLCSNGAAGVRARSLPLVIPRGHDCITLLLGSMAAYEDCFEKYPGTYWYSSGWIERSTPPGPGRSGAMRRMYAQKYGEEKAEALMEADAGQYANYSRAAYINWGLATAEGDIAFTRECAEFMGWEFEEVEGNPGLMADFLGGRWDDERFLVVAPGEAVCPSYDGRVICGGVFGGGGGVTGWGVCGYMVTETKSVYTKHGNES